MSIQRDTEARIRHELGLFFHRELDARYDTQYLQGVPEIASRGLLDVVDQEHLDRVKTFFKRVMYPVGDQRRHQDRHMERVRSMLSSPSSVISMLPRLPGLLLRHGARIASVSKAGLRVISAYQLARKQEERVIDALVDLCATEYGDVNDAADLPDEFFRRAYAAVPEPELRETIRLTEEIVRLGADEKLMDATVDVVQSVQDHTDDPAETEALEYVRSVINDVIDLSREFSPRQIERILELSRIVEHHYFGTLPAS